jgi:hypothetical protein
MTLAFSTIARSGRSVKRAGAMSLAAACVLGACVSASNAQTPSAAASQSPHVTSIAIYPVGLAEPALRFQLLPPEQDIVPGNAAARYLSALTLLPTQTPEDAEQIDKLLQSPLAEFDAKAAQVKVDAAKSALHIAFTGARTESANWESNLRREGGQALLPWLSPIRKLSDLLVLSIRIDIKNHRWNDACEKLQTGFALARHMGQGDTLIESLVGLLIAGRMESCLEDWVRQPGAPNLFWPLANLPTPFNDLRHPLNMERSWIYYQIPSVRDFVAGQYSVDGWYRLVKDVSSISKGVLSETGDTLNKGLGLLTAIADYPQAKQALIAQGASVEEVEQRPVAAVIEEFFVEQFAKLSDETFKWNGVPEEQVIPAWRAGKMDRPDLVNPTSFAGVICRFLSPALGNARFNAARLDRHLEMLRIVEALRAKAAEQGAFPDSLSDLSLPLPPLDSASGKSFVYTHDGNTATLSSPPTDDRTKDDEFRLSIHP